MILLVYIVFIILILFGVGWLKHKIDQRRLARVLKNVFKGSQIRQPTLKIGSAYSWPTFEIIFSTKGDLDLADSSGLIEQFKNKLKRRYESDFDPNIAVHCSYVGEEALLISYFDKKMSEMNANKIRRSRKTK